MAALARGGRQNLVGFVLRLVARLPFLFIAGRLYGADALGRFVSALVVIEVMAMICTVGEKRGLAQRLSEGGDENPALVVADGLIAALGIGLLAAGLLWLVPQPMFPSGVYTEVDRLLVLAIPMLALTEIMLAAQAYRFDIAATVRARSVVEPWTLSLMAGALFYVAPEHGLSLAYLASIFGAFVTAAWPFFRTYGRPRGWRPNPQRLRRLMGRGLPLAAIDTIEWGTRRLDVAILGLFVSPTAVGVYYVAQQVASLPQKLKTSFEPILGPVLTRKLKEKDYAAIAKQVCQVGFWITAAQAGIGLTLGIPGEAVMALAGANFIGGTGALGLLLAAEVVAATAVVSEAALVYVARLRNLWVSIGTIALQAVLTVAAMLAIERFDLNENYRAAGAAGALLIALAFASIVKGWMLSRILGHPINNWRWSLVVAAAAAVVVGQGVIRFPDWFQLTIGAAAIFGTYALIIWTRGFGPEDRLLFTRKLTTEEPPAEPGIDTPGPRW
ncbi:MAG: polysaccharide biosynthesis protein [Sphingomonadales bacterium 12-68-11]|nr:MAG: polysaccharide biosynthesis protein [Sphingomonadales bacterium 12-68-11]